MNGTDSHDIRHLLLWLCLAAIAAVAATLLANVLHHRRHAATNFHSSLPVELAWTLMPMLIVIGLLLPAFATALFTR